MVGIVEWDMDQMGEWEFIRLVDCEEWLIGQMYKAAGDGNPSIFMVYLRLRDEVVKEIKERARKGHLNEK